MYCPITYVKAKWWIFFEDPRLDKDTICFKKGIDCATMGTSKKTAKEIYLYTSLSNDL